MIKIFNNKTNFTQLIIKSAVKKADINTEYTQNTEQVAYDISNQSMIFVHVVVSGLLDGDTIGKVLFSLRYLKPKTDCTLQIIKCSQTSLDDTYLEQFMNSLTGNELAIDTQTITINNLDEGNNFLTFDIANLVKNGGGTQIFMFAIKNNLPANEKLTIFTPELDNEKMITCQGTYSIVEGLYGLYKYDCQTIDNVGQSNINLYNLHLVHVFNGLTSLSQKAPISFCYYYSFNKRNEVNFMPNKFTPSFQYHITKDKDDYCLEDPSGAGLFYVKLDPTSEYGKKIIENYIFNYEENGLALYFCDLDYSFFYLDTSDPVKEKITLYNQNKNKTTFEVALYASYSTTQRQTKILLNEDKYGHKVEYIWSGKTLEKIKNSDGEEVLLTYDSLGKVIKVYFKTLYQYVQFTYDTTAHSIIAGIYSDKPSSDTTKVTIVKLQEIQITYDIDIIKSIEDKITNRKMIISMSSGVVTNIDLTNPQKIEDSTKYQTNGNFTTITKSSGRKYYYYFDSFGRCKIELNDKGQSVNYNYDEYENGESKHLSNVSKVQSNARNLLENHSFENEDNLFKDSLSWQKEDDKNIASFKVKDGGIYGSKYLEINITGTDFVRLYQIVSTSTNITGNVVLKGFIRHSFVSLGTINIVVGGYYFIQEGENTFSKEFYNETLDNFKGTSSFEEFSLETHIPDNAQAIYMEVIVSIKGEPCRVDLDDFQLCSKEQIIRYNLVENGYLDFQDNSLPRGWLFVNKDSEDKLEEIVTAEEHLPILGNYVMTFKAGPIKFNTNNERIIKKMYRSIACKGLANEKLIFSVFAKATVSDGCIFRSYIKLFFDDQTTHTYQFDFDKNFQNWQVLTRAINVEQDYNKVEVGIEYSGSQKAQFDAFQLYKDNYGKYYNYDDKGNITEVISDDGQNMRIDYDNDNQITQIVANDGSCFVYNYDSLGRLATIEDLAGNVLKLTYDSYDYIAQTEIQVANSSETIITKQTNNKYGAALTLTDEYGNVTRNTVDYLNQLIQVRYQNGLVEKTTYNADINIDNISAVIDNVTNKSTFTYDTTNQIISLASASDTNYKFSYDDAGRIICINNGDVIVNQFSYAKVVNGINQGLLTSKQNGLHGAVYEYFYNDDDLLTRVDKNGITLVKYSYNEAQNVAKIEDLLQKRTKYYTYDLKGNLLKVVDNLNYTTLYSYDNLDNVQKTSYNQGYIKKSYDYEYVYETNEYTKEGYFNRIERTFTDEVIKGGQHAKGTYGAKGQMINCFETYDSTIKMKVFSFTNNLQYITYDLSTLNTNRNGIYSNGKPFNLETWQTSFRNSKTFYMWIKPKTQLATESLLTFEYQENEIAKLFGDLQILNDGYVAYYSGNANNVIAKTNNKVNLGSWNLIGLKIYKDSSGITRANIFVNDTMTNSFSISEDVSFIVKVHVALQSATVKPTTNFPMPFDICMMSFGAYDYSENNIKTIYNEGQKYLVSNNKITKSSGVSYYSSLTYQDLDVVTLNGSLESTSGVKPIQIVKTDSTFKGLKAQLFEYDFELGKHVFGIFDHSLISLRPLLGYHLNLTNTAIISLRFKPMTITTSQSRYVFYSENIKVYLDNNKTLHFNIGKSSSGEVRFQKIITYDMWHSFVIYINTKEINVYVDNARLDSSSNNTTLTLDLSNDNFYLGSLANGQLPLNGYLEMFAFSDKNETDTSIQLKTAQRIYTMGSCIEVKNKYDDFGRVTKKVIKTWKGEYSQNYVFDKLRVVSEYETDSHNFKYEYDNVGNLTKISRYIKNFIEDERTYKYDTLGRLVEAANYDGSKENYYYDANGNITNVIATSNDGTITKQLQYSYEKDKLLTIDDGHNTTTYCYEQSDDVLPTKIMYNNSVKATMSWDGRNLVKYNTGTTGTTFSYEYNADGLRTKKIHSQFTESYELDGDRIISLLFSSTGPNYKLEFNYNEQGELVSVSCEDKEFFYIRDVTGCIYELVDEQGIVVANYKYDAWGKLLSSTCNSNNPAALYNPFLYKGYFYDKETQLYWVSSRYYSPELCRWISPDSIEYLDPQSINGLNLYAYCGNDPVNHIDPSGHAWYHWAIGAGIIVLCAALTVVTAGGFAAAGTAFASVVSATMAPTALSAVFAGATIGAAAIGTAGMVIGGMSGEDGWSWENASQGFMAGSIAGAVIGGAWGGAHYALQSAGKMAIRTNINNLVNNPLDEFVTVGPKDGGISGYVRSISQTGDYGQIFASKLPNGMYQIANGHHRVAALRQLGYKYVNFFLVP